MDISAELIGILSVGVALGGLMLKMQGETRRDIRQLGERVARIEGLIERVARIEGLIEGAALFRPADAPVTGD